MKYESMRAAWLTALLAGLLFTPLAGASRVQVHPERGQEREFTGHGDHTSRAGNGLVYNQERNRPLRAMTPGAHDRFRQAIGNHDAHNDFNALFSIDLPHSRSHAHEDKPDSDSKKHRDSDESDMPGEIFHGENDHDHDGPGTLRKANSGSQALVPAPSALWLFGSGMFGLAAVARRR